MELFLNSIWLLVAIAAFLFWQAEAEESATLRREHSSRCRVLSLSCALILLFPVISLTDDLHAEQAPMEDSSRSVMKARNLAQGHLRASRSPIPLSVTPAAYFGAALNVVTGTAVRIQTLHHCKAPTSSHDGRSPPFSA